MARIPLEIAGFGHALPAEHLDSTEIERRLGLKPGRIAKATKVIRRPVARDEDQIGLALAASRAALADAGVDAASLDLVIGASAIPYQTLPATAPLLMRELGLAGGQAAAFDVNATCLSFLTGLETAALRIAAGLNQCVLVFSSEIASRALPWEDEPEIAALFGDGAAAMVVRRGETGGIVASRMETHPEAYEASGLISGGTRIDFHADPVLFARHARFRMDGKALFKITHRHFARFVDGLLADAGWHRDDVDLVVPHQASPLALDHMITATGFARSRVIDIASTFGNQIAASIPTALSLARATGRIAPGSRLLMLGTAAGVTFGGMALEIGR